MKAATLRRLMNLWPPFLLSGIHVETLSADWRQARVALRMRPWNRNYFGTHFGGSLFAMTDPFWMIMVAEHLGGDYYVWDKAAEIEFVKPGRGKVETTFQLGDDVLDAIRTAAQGGDKHLHWFESVLHDEAGDVVARVRKQVYVRLKQRARAPAP